MTIVSESRPAAQLAALRRAKRACRWRIAMHMALVFASAVAGSMVVVWLYFEWFRRK